MERKNLITLAAAAVIIVAAAALAVVLIGHSGDDGYKGITYYGNGGTYDGNDSFRSTVITAEPNRFERSGYVFSGWNTEADGSGDAYPVGKPVGLGLRLYAQWTLGTASG